MRNERNRPIAMPLLLVAALSGLIATWAAGPVTGARALGASGQVMRGGIGDAIAGTWITDPTPPSQGGGPGARYLMGIQAGGTLIWNANWEQGPVGGFKTSTAYGSWIQTGPQEITSKEMWFLYSHDGVHQYITRFTTVYSFDPDFKTFSAELFEELFLPDQDPTNPDEVPVFTGGDSWTAKRLDSPV
jgi:hypothetical protein